METAKGSSGKVYCSLPEHSDEIIIMIDRDPEAQKLLYCCLCMMEQSTRNLLPKTLTTFKAFINDTSQTYEKAKIKACKRGEAPPELADQLSKKAEFLEKLTNHLNQEKAKLNIAFDDIRESILSIIDQKQKNYIDMIDEELQAACDLFEKFERVLITGWPKTTDLPQIFPSIVDIEQRLTRVDDPSRLESIVGSFKEDIKFERMFSEEDDDGKQSRRAHLEELINNFKDIEANLPTLDLTDLRIGKLSDQLQEKLSQVLDSKAKILDTISNSPSSISELLKQKDIDLLKSWIPNQYRFNFKLIYKSSIDGGAASDFHAKCDNKGPTITVIKCRFNGSNQDSFIGGFIDKSWHSNSSYTQSQDAFVFSLTNKKKCSIILNHQYATFGDPSYGPTFGGGYDIFIENNQLSGYVNPYSYVNSKTIIDAPNYSGSGKAEFSIEDIEVFSLN